MRNKAVKAYLRAVRRRLVCGRDSRARLIRRLEQMTDDLLEENPDANLIEAFGPLEALAADMLGTCPEAEVGRTRTRLTWMRRGLAAALVLVAAASCLFGYYMHKTQGGTVIITTTIYKDGPAPSFWNNVENGECVVQYQTEEDNDEKNPIQPSGSDAMSQHSITDYFSRFTSHIKFVHNLV